MLQGVKLQTHTKFVLYERRDRHVGLRVMSTDHVLTVGVQMRQT